MALPIRNSEADEEEPSTSIDQCLVDAVLHPQFRHKLLGMEAKIHQVLEDPNLEKVEFPECHTFHLKSLADKLARHYRLESRCKERRAFARKTPESKIPSVTLSGILVKRSNGAASSSTTLCLPELTDPVKREEEHCKARERIFNESGPASSTAPLVSSSTPPVVSSSSSLVVSRSISPNHNGIGEEVDQDDGLSDMHAETNSVNNHGANMASSFRSPSVSRSASPIYSEIGEEVDQDGLSDMHTETNPVHNLDTNMNHSPTNSMYGSGTGDFNEVPTTGQQPLPMQNTPSTLQHEAVQYEPRIQQSQMYQYGSSIQQPQMTQYEPRIQQSQMYQYGSSIQQPQMMQYEPSIAQPYMQIPYYNYYPYNLAYPYGAGTSPYYACSAPQLAWVQLVQPTFQEPMQYQYQYQPGTAQPPMNSFIQNNQGAVRPRCTSYGRARGRSS